MAVPAATLIAHPKLQVPPLWHHTATTTAAAETIIRIWYPAPTAAGRNSQEPWFFLLYKISDRV